MGGNAFHQQLPADAFPRIPTTVYEVVKARLLARLQSLYERVVVPCEAPGKIDHGDLDFLVVGARTGTPGQNALDGVVKHEDVKNALGATVSICLQGNRTSHFAVPVDHSEWKDGGRGADEQSKKASDGIYYQVDVHVCADEDELERTFFFHSYGDLGMILGLLARNNGLAFGTKGLKLPDPPNPPFHLSSSFPTILQFFGLSLDTWTQKFATKLQVFEWVGTSRFFDPAEFRSEGEGIRKIKEDRKMYAEFVEWVIVQRRAHELVQESRPGKENTDLINEALVYFGRQEAFDELARSRTTRARFKTAFNGQKVTEWAGLDQKDQNWQALKLIMDGIRQRLGGDDDILSFWEQNGEEGLKRLTLEVKAELGLMNGLTESLARMDTGKAA